MSAHHKLATIALFIDLTYALRPLNQVDAKVTREAGTPMDIPTDARAVWLDIGTAGRSDFEYDFLNASPNTYLIGMEPTPEYAMQMKDKLDSSGRFAMFQNACAEKSGEHITFYVHKLQECNSLNPVNSKSPSVHNGNCVGAPATQIMVTTINLEEVLRQVPASVPIEVLKIDVQGHEWPCLKGAGVQLDRVANVFLEVQDIESGTTEMYQNSLSLGDMDIEMEKQQFFRQYCEANEMTLREFNCLYTRKGETPLWVTGRPQGSQPTVKYDLENLPKFRSAHYIFEYKTSEKPGEMAVKLQNMLDNEASIK